MIHFFQCPGEWRGHGRLRQGDVQRVPGRRDGPVCQAGQGCGHHHHHGTHSGQEGPYPHQEGSD